MTRVGRRNLQRWRVGVFDARTRRDGKAIEYLGSYNPHEENGEKKLDVDMERVQEWLDKGAQPTETVANLLKKAGLEL